MSTLKQRFAQLAAHRPDITQADVARAAGVTAPSVSAWFSGKTESMKATTAAKVAILDGCDSHWLATGEGNMLTAAEGIFVAEHPVSYHVRPTVDVEPTVSSTLMQLQATVDSLTPLLREAGLSLLHLWLDGKASLEEVAATLDGLQKVSADAMKASKLFQAKD